MTPTLHSEIQIQIDEVEVDSIYTSGTRYIEDEGGLTSVVEGNGDLNLPINPIRWILPKYADTYRVENFRNNAMIIFNHENFRGGWTRHGTMEDQKMLQETFEKLNFIVEPHLDLTKEKVMEELKNFSARNFTQCGCVCVAIMTHGSGHGQLRAFDMPYHEEDLLEYFDGRKNPTLVGKPIIFLIEACRGDTLAPAVSTENEVISMMPKYSNDVYHYELPISANTFIFHSSFFGEASVSWFIQTLCKKINLLAGTEDFQTICTAVQKEIALDKSVLEYPTLRLEKQMPMITSTLIRRLFLRPSGVVDQYFHYMIESLRSSSQDTYVYLGEPFWGGKEISPDIKSLVWWFFRRWLARPMEYCLKSAVLVTPYLKELPDGMLPGQSVLFCGQVPIDCVRFCINLQCGPNKNILSPSTPVALHMDFRLNYSRVEVVLNSFEFGQCGWGREKLGVMPLHQGKNFDLQVHCNPTSFNVYVNGDFYCEFLHRGPWEDIKYILVHGDVTLALVAFEKSIIPYLAGVEERRVPT